MIYILLPVYNEEESLKELLDSIMSHMKKLGMQYCILAVDDGSTDATGEILKEYMDKCGLKLVSHERNMGLGMAINTGIRELSGKINKGDLVVTMDADNTHPPVLIERIAAEIRNGADVVIASRYQEGAVEKGVPLARIVLSRCANLLLRSVFPYNGVRDYSSGYRGYSADILLDAKKRYAEGFIEEGGFSVMAEIIIKLSFLSPKIKEVPLTLMYSKKRGKSKIKIVDTIKNYLYMIIKLRRMKKSLKNL